MAARRFDTETLLKQLLEHRDDAFKALYDRYRGRVYRFIVRQCGNGEEGEAAYIAIWAHLIHARHACKDEKSLKLAFLRSLRRPSLNPLLKTSMVLPHTLMPKELEQEGGWSTLLVEMVRRLPEGLRKRFLFRYEIGLSLKAIATVFEEDGSTTRAHLGEAERILTEGLVNAGWKRSRSLGSLYQETRLLKPPISWDQEVLLSYPDWLNDGVPESLLKLTQKAGSRNRISNMKALFKKAVNQLRAEIASKTQQRRQTGS